MSKGDNKKKTGFIYVLTNESFHKENWIKIGYAEDVDKRVKELSGTAVPLPYEVYCTYEIPRIEGTQDPDKQIHKLIQLLNPDLRITANREFFELAPWDAYNMLLAIAEMHGRKDKLKRNNKNDFGNEAINETTVSVGALFPNYNKEESLYKKLVNVILSIDSTLVERPSKIYVGIFNGKINLFSLWPRKNSIEVVLKAKLGTINDPYGIIYDISNRKWSTEQYAIKVYDDSDFEAVKAILLQVYNLKTK